MKTIFAARAIGLSVIMAVGACASSQVLTQGEVGRSGARAFSASKDMVFATCVGALTAEGYEIASRDPASGVIVTQALAVRAPGRVTSRAYRVTVSADAGGTRVVAQPILYSGARDISNSDAWVLDGPDGERAQWSDLFGVMTAALAAPELPAPANDRREAVAANGAAPPLGKEQAAPATSSEKTSTGTNRGLTPASLTTQPASGSTP